MYSLHTFNVWILGIDKENEGNHWNKKKKKKREEDFTYKHLLM